MKIDVINRVKINLSYQEAKRLGEVLDCVIADNDSARSFRFYVQDNEEMDWGLIKKLAKKLPV